MQVYATIHTAHNYRNLNGHTLEVVEMNQTRVSCWVHDDEFGLIISDFTLKEVTALYYGTHASQHGEKLVAQSETALV
jgi:hypothetical protein